MSTRDVWDGRPVTFAEFTIREGKAVNEAFAQGGEEGSYMLLVLSMRWADTGEPVFAEVNAIEALPYRLRNTLVRLSSKAAFVNGMTSDDPDAPVTGNGHDTAASASPSH